MEIQKKIDYVKTTLESFLTSETSKETIDAIAKASQALDDVVSSNSDLEKQLSTMRKDYIDMVKQTGFKANADDKGDDNSSDAPKSIEEIAAAIIAKRKK